MTDNTSRRPRSLRRFFQFSLRTYLVLSVLGAVGLWCAMYWLREYWPQLAGSWGPPPTEVALPGGWKAREHQRTVTDEQTGEKKTVRQGRYELIDQHGYTRCVGAFHDDSPSGLWTYYHDNGRRAMQGECREGFRDGVWRAWHDNGHAEWEITHTIPSELDEFTETEFKLWNEARPASFVQFSSLSASPSSLVVEPPAISSLREGPARTWWDNGQLHSRGSHHFDRRDGEWMFWNLDGVKTSAGNYERGRRRGKWSKWDEAGSENTVYYAAGLRIENLANFEAQLREALAANDRAAALESIAIFGDIGPDAAAQLAPAIAHEGDEEIVRAALAEAIPMHDSAKTLLPQFQAAQKRWRGTTATIAKIARASADSERRRELLRQIVAELNDAAWEEEAMLYDRLADAGADCVPTIAAMLDDQDAATRNQAAVVLARLHETVVLPVVGVWNYWPPRLDDPHWPAYVAVRKALRKAEQHGDADVAAIARQALQGTRPGQFQGCFF
jgi:antitoxin component YwqK of YwqJK toxin-antitoxin module